MGIAALSEFQLARGMRRLLFSGKTSPPSLPDFLKLCRSLGGDGEVDEGPQPLGLPNPDSWTGDRWDILSNEHFLGHITRRLAANSRCYGPVKPHEFRLDKSNRPVSPASPQQDTAVRILLRYKAAWAADMREGKDIDTATGELISYTPDEQREAWKAIMDEGENAVALALGAAAA